MTNPLLDVDVLPRFSEILPEHVEPALTYILAENRRKIAELLQQAKPYTWNSLVEPLEELDDRFDKMWSSVSHLNAALNSDALRETYHACLPILSAYATEIGQNEELYNAYKSIAESNEFAELNQVQQRVIQDTLLDFQLSGVGLNPEAKKRYAALQEQLALLTSRFEENVLDATKAWHYRVKDSAGLAGLPEHAVSEAKELADEQELDGWIFTLDVPSYCAVMSYADNREMREKMHMAYVTRASDAGPNAGEWDNSPVMAEICALRQELALLLGFANFAELSLATKMAKSPAQVLDFLHDLARRSQELAADELQELTEFAADMYGIAQLNSWDYPYYTEKLRQYRYELSQEDLRPYFPEDRVLFGMFATLKHLYGLHVIEVADVDVWHKDVRFFEVRDQEDKLRGQFYLDLYARPNKRGGAWMDECRVRRRLLDGSIQTPVAFLTCNFSPPMQGKPPLFTHEEVITLFHEFGHGLHHMVTQIDYASVSGINGVPWDAVEFPSQFLENWCWEKEALDLISGHYETGEPLPAELLEKMLAAKNFQSAMHMMRQLEFSLFDFRLHLLTDVKQPEQIQKVLDEVREQVSVAPVSTFNRFQHAFTHVFSGGYAAGYYSYKWAEVLASDAFAKFEEHGIFNSEIGQQFLTTILEQGGSRDPMELFVEFRGRKPTIDALLRHSGLA